MHAKRPATSCGSRCTRTWARNRDEPGDDDHSNRYTRAARFLRNWQRERVLFTEGDPAIYVYHQEFELDGRTVLELHSLTRERVQAAIVIDRKSSPKLDSHTLIVEGERMDDKASGHAASPCTAGIDYRSHANRVTTIRGASASERRPPRLEFYLDSQQGKRYLTRHY